MEKDRAYKLAFAFLKRMNAGVLKEVASRGITPEDFFTLPTKELVNRLGIRQEHEFDRGARDEALSLAKKELEKIKSHNIETLFLLDEDYPQRLAETDEPPIVLYKLGEAELEEEHMISVVGTRKPTAYGLDFCDSLIGELGDCLPDSVVISGLAYGIDVAAHKKALEKGLKTVAVLAHGLNMIYPAAHRNLAKEIIRTGGALLTEYPFDVTPFKPNFLARNRIVAGLSDVTVVVESNIKGGAMSTANYAFMYNREVMALPGRSIDDESSGCNRLIKKNKAHLIENLKDLIEVTGWSPLNLRLDEDVEGVIPELAGESSEIYERIRQNREPVVMDELVHHTGLPASKLLGILSELEFEGYLIRLPGNRWSIRK